MISDDELPEGWAVATLGNLSAPAVEQAGPRTEEFDYLDIGSIDNREKTVVAAKRLRRSEAPSRARQTVKSGDVLVSMTRPNLNAVALVSTEYDGAIASTGFTVLRPVGVLPEWIFGVVRARSFVEAMTAKVQGALYPAIRQADVHAFECSVPPLNEQRRIVKALEEAHRRVLRARNFVQSAKDEVVELRKFILAAAFRGDLTADWREKNLDVEPASVLLDRIRKERRQKWQESETRKMQVKGREPTDDRWKEEYVEPETADPESLPELPKGWVWATGLQCCEAIANGGTPPLKYMAGSGDVPFVKVYNLTKSGELDFSVNPTFIPQSVHRGLLNRSRAIPGDVLMNIVGPPLGKVSIVPDTYREWNFNQAIVSFRMLPGVHREYMSNFLLSDVTARWAAASSKATAGQFNISVNACRAMPVPLPPLEEQLEIVRTLRALANHVSTLAASVEMASERLRELESAILNKAFRGKLVSQDPNDEPATVLLERIRSRSLAPSGEPRSNSRPKTHVPATTSESQPSATTPRSPVRKTAADPPLAVQRIAVEERPPEDLLAAIRRVLVTGGHDRDALIRDVARDLGFARAGSTIRAAIDGAINTASRRLIIRSEGGLFSLYSPSVEDYGKDELMHLFLAAIGTTWWDRDEAIRATARYLGFKRTGERIDKLLRSVINGLIRQGRLERQGTRIRRVRTS